MVASLMTSSTRSKLLRKTHRKMGSVPEKENKHSKQRPHEGSKRTP